MTAATSSTARDAEHQAQDLIRTGIVIRFLPLLIPMPTRGLGTEGPHTTQQHGSSVLLQRGNAFKPTQFSLFSAQPLCKEETGHFEASFSKEKSRALIRCWLLV